MTASPWSMKPERPQAPGPPAHKAFESYQPGPMHVEVKYLPQMHDESSRRHLFVAIDRATPWVSVQLKARKTGACARAFCRP